MEESEGFDIVYSISDYAEGQLTEEQKEMVEDMLSILDGDVEKIIALALHKDLETITEVLGSITHKHDNTYACDENEYLVLDDDEADSAFDDELDYIIDDIVYEEFRLNNMQHYWDYFDDKKYQEDMKYDGRGHYLNRYDGNEYEEKVNGINYYIYQQ